MQPTYSVWHVSASEEKAQEFGVKAARVLCKPNAEQLAAISTLIDEGRLKAHVSTVNFPKVGAHVAKLFCTLAHRFETTGTATTTYPTAA